MCVNKCKCHTKTIGNKQCKFFLKRITSYCFVRKSPSNKAFANPEDTIMHKVKVRQDDNVERVRRAHLNDLENIPIYFLASFGYMLTNPPAALALMLFRAFTAARFIHTFVYAIVVIPQPARGLSWAVGYFITGYMAAQTALHFIN